jgi:NitT/TauT family transport system substrate-binding protein
MVIMNSKIIMVAVVLVAIIALSAYLFISNYQRTDVRIGWFPVACELPFFVAMERGYFQEQGLNVTAVKFESANLIMDSLLSGKIDAAACIGYTTLFSIESASTNQFKMFGNEIETDTKYQSFLLVRNDSNISSISDLTGKKIGTYTGTTQLLWLRLLMNKFGIDAKDITIIQVGLPLQVQALLSGQMDVLLTIEPYVTTALDKGAKAFMANPRGKYILNPFPAAPSGVVSSKFLKENPDVAIKIKAAMDRAVDFISLNEGVAKRYFPKYTPITEDLAPKVLIYEMEKNPANKTAIQVLADILYEGGEIKNPINTSTMWYG